MKIKKIFTFVVMLVLGLTICAKSANIDYLQKYSWQVIYRCYDDDCDWSWKLCNEVCFNRDGLLYNRLNVRAVGEWTENYNGTIEIRFYSNGGELSGTIFLSDSPAAAMDGQGFSIYDEGSRFIKIMLIRKDRR